jgi:hypothetical protein
MAHLKYYEMEREKFSEASKKVLYFGHAEIVFRKLRRHYKLYPHITLRMGRGNHANQYHVTIANPTNFLVLCHELAHSKHLMQADRGERWHGKKHFRIMKSMIHYCQRKKWFEAEIARRTAPKPPKPKPSEQDNLDKIKLRIKVWESKKSRAENKLKKLRKQEKSIQSRISRPQLPPYIDNKVNDGEDTRNPPHQVPIPVEIKAD